MPLDPNKDIAINTCEPRGYTPEVKVLIEHRIADTQKKFERLKILYAMLPSSPTPEQNDALYNILINL